MKRFLSIFLTVAMLMTLITVFAVTNVNAATVVSNSAPVITANAGTAVNLSGYSVVFDGDSSATSGVTWKNSSGTTITSITPSAGVTKLTATSGSKTKTVYVVAKSASESEYVLYEAKMSDFGSVAALRNAGWTMPSTDQYYSFNGGNLQLLTTSAYTGSFAYLPAWLADFGDYNISVEAKVDSCYNNDTSRWMSVIYRATTPNDDPTYYHYCVRDAASSNGVEFTERISGGNYWNVAMKSSARATTLQDGYHTFGVQSFGGNIKYTLDGRQCLYMDENTYNSKITVKNTKGYIGIQTKGLNLSIKSVKITVQETTPSLDEAFDLINIGHDETTLVDSYANIQTVSGSNYASVLAAEDAPDIAYIKVSELSDVAAAITACVKAKAIPTFYITSNAEADKVVAAMNVTGCEDVTAVSNSASVLAYIRNKKYMVRTGLEVTLTKGTLTSKEAHAIRVNVRSAPASFCVIDSTYATKQAVAELQELAVAVWVKIAAAPNTTAYEIEAVKAITSGANGFISANSDALTAVINKHFIDGTMVRTPIVVGHRGNPSQAAENSMESFRAAYKNGADIFELDCYVTSDNRIVIYHDHNLVSTPGLTTAPSTLTTNLNSMTLAQIQQYTYSTGEKIPTLDDVLAEFKNADIRIYVEFKGGNAAQNVKLTSQLIKNYDMEDRVDVICSATSFLTETYKSTNMYGMSTGYLCYPEPANVTDMTTALQSLYNGIAMVQPVNSSLNQLCNRTAGGYFGQAATDRGLTVWPWGYGLSALNTAFFTGCDGITVDHAEWFTKMAKDVYASNFALAEGQTSAGGVLTVNTYGRTSYIASPADLVYSVISGGENVKIENGKLVGVKEGTATVVIGLKTATTDSGAYVIYAQPVTVTVGGTKDALKPLIEAAKGATVNDYSVETLATIRELYEEAVSLYNSSSASASAITELCVEFADALNDVCYVENVSIGVDYTTTPNTRSDGYADDGVKLVDGIKGQKDGGTNKSSGWGKIGNVEIVLDFGETISTNEYNAYLVSGAWGIPNPENSKVSLSVFSSDDGVTYTKVDTTTELTVVSGTGVYDDTWSAHKMSIISSKDITARYIKFSFDYSGNHLWMDEVEAIYNHGTPAAEEVVYVDGFNTPIGKGNCFIFTPDHGTLTLETANHVWTQNVRAKWNAEAGAYIVTEVFHGQGVDATPDITLASDEILICAHNWEGTGVTDPVAGSMQNANNLATASVGDTVIVHGLDIKTKTLGIAPSLTFSHVHVPGDAASCTSAQNCTLCGTELAPKLDHVPDEWITLEDYSKELHCAKCGELMKTEAHVHDDGEWITLDDGSKELKCTVCGKVLDTEPAPEQPPVEPDILLGDVNDDGVIDMFDYLLVKSFYFEVAAPTEDEALRADMNEDGVIDMFDYLMVKTAYFNS